MGFWSELKALYSRDSAPVRPLMIGTNTTGLISGVSATTSLGLSAVWRCLDILSNGVSQLPWREMRGNLELPPSRLVDRPSAAFGTRREWVSYVVSTMALFDCQYLLPVGGQDVEGQSIGLWPLDPNLVSPVTVDMFSIAPASEYWVGQEKYRRDELRVLRRSPQPTLGETAGGIITLARAKFAEAIAVEQYATRYWQSGGNPTVALTTDLHLNPGEAKDVQDEWASRRAKGPDYSPVLTGGLKATPFGADPATEAAVEVRRELVADIGRFFGIPTRMVNAPTGDSETYTSTESANLDLVRFTLQNYIGAIEDVISDELPGLRRMEMDTSILTRGTQLARAQAWQLALGSNQPWMLPEEVREEEHLPPREIAAAPVATASLPVGGNRNGV